MKPVGRKQYVWKPPDTPPTPEEIRERCAEIQAEWNERTRLDRTNPLYRPVPWTVPGVAAAGAEPT